MTLADATTAPSAHDFDATALRDACGAFATGVTLVTTRLGERDHGMTANAFMSISLDPPLIAVSIGRHAKMLPLISQAGRYAVSILRSGGEDVALHFAGRPDDAITDPLTEIDGLPVARSACATFTTDVEREIDAGDHMIFLGRVRTLQTDPDAHPLTFHRGKFGRLKDETPPILDPDWMFSDRHW